MGQLSGRRSRYLTALVGQVGLCEAGLGGKSTSQYVVHLAGFPMVLGFCACILNPVDRGRGICSFIELADVRLAMLVVDPPTGSTHSVKAAQDTHATCSTSAFVGMRSGLDNDANKRVASDESDTKAYAYASMAFLLESGTLVCRRMCVSSQKAASPRGRAGLGAKRAPIFPNLPFLRIFLPSHTSESHSPGFRVGLPGTPHRR